MINNISETMPTNPGSGDTAPWKTLIVSGIIFAIMLLIAAIIAWGYKPALKSSIRKNEARITELDNVAPKAETEARFIRFYSQLSNIGVLLSTHTSLIPVFSALESNTMEYVGISSMAIDVDSRKMDIDAFADSFETLAGQVALYQSIPNADKITLQSSVLSDKIVSFKLKGEFSSLFFKFVPIIEQQIDQSEEQEAETNQ
jgi:hypothetical protein